MKKFYGIQHNDYSLNDSDEKIRYWGTATVIAFNSKKERDEWCDESFYNMPITAKRAKYIGVTDAEELY